MAIEARYTEKIRDNRGNIVSYNLVDQQGNTINISSRELKNYIVAGKINVQNLTLTSDNRLMDAGDKRMAQYVGIAKTPDIKKLNMHKLVENGVKTVGLTFDIEKMTENMRADGYASGMVYRSEVINTPCFGEWELIIKIYNKDNNINNLDYYIILCEADHTNGKVGIKDYSIGFEKSSQTALGYKASCKQINEILKRLMISKEAYKTNKKALDKMINLLYKHNEIRSYDGYEPISLQGYTNIIYNNVNN